MTDEKKLPFKKEEIPQQNKETPPSPPKTLAFLTYEFLFNPAQTWPTILAFEDSFASFLKLHQMEGQFIDSANPKEFRRIMYIKKNTTPAVMGEDPKIQNPQNIIRKSLKENARK